MVSHSTDAEIKERTKKQKPLHVKFPFNISCYRHGMIIGSIKPVPILCRQAVNPEWLTGIMNGRE
jgi:hypothetical protein